MIDVRIGTLPLPDVPSGTSSQARPSVGNFCRKLELVGQVMSERRSRFGQNETFVRHIAKTFEGQLHSASRQSTTESQRHG